MRKTSKALAMLTVLPLAFALQGCGGEDSKVRVTPPSQDHVLYQPGTHPRFDPGGSDLPFNNDLIFLTAATAQGDDAFDGTAHIDQPDDRPANPVINAVNSLDGFSTNAPFDILFRGRLNPTSVSPANVFLLPLNTVAGGEALSPEDIDLANPFGAPAPIAVQVVSLGEENGEVNDAIRVLPLQPLKPKTKYLVLLTNGLQPILDADGSEITRSWVFNALSSPGFNAGGALAPVKQLVSGWNQLSAGFLQAASSGALDAEAAAASIRLSYTFTTSAPMDVLHAMAAPRAALVNTAEAMGLLSDDLSRSDLVNLITMGEAFDLLSTPRPKAREVKVSAATAVDLGDVTGLPASVGHIYTGAIKLPYYQTAPAIGADPADVSYSAVAWSADDGIATVIGGAIPDAPALLRPDVDGETYNVTYRYPFAKQQSEEWTPLQVTLPDQNFVPTEQEFQGASCGAFATMANGYPVVMYIHGIGSDRTSVVALAHTLAARCIATVAIDLAMHGVYPGDTPNPFFVQTPAYASLYGSELRERHFFHPSGSALAFMNLAELRNARDNLRQSVMDQLNLNASLVNVNAALQAESLGGLNLDDVTVVGASLGGIVGTVYAAVNQQALEDENGTEFTSDLVPVNGLVASAAGAQLTEVLMNSQTIGPQIIGGLQLAGIEQGTVNFGRFMYAAQSTVDSGDPVAFAEALAALQVPVLVQQIVGGGDASGVGDSKAYTADKVVPNVANLTNAPLGGTTPLAQLLGADALPAGVVDMNSHGNALVNVTVGHHGSLLRPSESGDVPATTGEGLMTQELLTQVVTFVLNMKGLSPATAVGTAGSNAAAQFITTDMPSL